MNLVDYGDVSKATRQALHLDQRAWAARLGMSRNDVNLIETGMDDPSPRFSDLIRREAQHAGTWPRHDAVPAAPPPMAPAAVEDPPARGNGTPRVAAAADAPTPGARDWGAVLGGIRARARLTQAQAAERLGVCKVYVGNLEHGRRKPSPECQAKIAALAAAVAAAPPVAPPIMGPEIGALLRRTRKARGLSQTEMGALLGLSVTRVSRIEAQGLGPHCGTLGQRILDLAGDVPISPLSPPPPSPTAPVAETIIPGRATRPHGRETPLPKYARLALRSREHAEKAIELSEAFVAKFRAFAALANDIRFIMDALDDVLAEGVRIADQAEARA